MTSPPLCGPTDRGAPPVAGTGSVAGHVSVQTTERYLGCKQNLGRPVNDRFNPRSEVQVREPNL
jgi:hypothetical protein